MKILFISWYFPPGNDVGALRTGAFARFFAEHGHEIHVLTANRKHPDESLMIPLCGKYIERTPFFDVDHPFRSAKAIARIESPKADLPTRRKGQDAQRTFARLRAMLSSTYVNLTHIPDRQVGWLPYAIAAGGRRLRRTPIDVLYASGPPFTTHLIARTLARRFSVPWVAEYRDPWCYYLYEPREAWHQRLNARIEDATVSTAAGIVALTDLWAEYFREKFRKPTVTIYNGYDFSGGVLTARVPRANEPVVISYFGSLYGSVRNPSALYLAIQRSGLSPAEIRVAYYGPSSAEISPLAERYRMLSYIDINSRVPLNASLRIQRDSDVLLLIQSPDDKRNVPAKLFEYLGSRRPILGIGLDDGLPAKLIVERKAGFYVSDPNRIAERLKAWSREKKLTGFIADTPPDVLNGLSPGEQFRKLEIFLETVALGDIQEPG